MSSVLCAGIVVADHVSSPISHLPAAGELVLADQLLLTIGGCAANVAVNLVKLGVPATVAGCVGDDVFGRVVADMLRGPVFGAGLAVGAREGVNVSAGWQLSQVVECNSTLMSVKQMTLDHTHYETVDGCWAATELYGKVFKPTVHKEIYPFEDLPRAFAEMHHGTR